jgi:hypothetical protein
MYACTLLQILSTPYINGHNTDFAACFVQDARDGWWGYSRICDKRLMAGKALFVTLTLHSTHRLMRQPVTLSISAEE